MESPKKSINDFKEELCSVLFAQLLDKAKELEFNDLGELEDKVKYLQKSIPYWAPEIVPSRFDFIVSHLVSNCLEKHIDLNKYFAEKLNSLTLETNWDQ